MLINSIIARTVTKFLIHIPIAFLKLPFSLLILEYHHCTKQTIHTFFKLTYLDDYGFVVEAEVRQVDSSSSILLSQDFF